MNVEIADVKMKSKSYELMSVAAMDVGGRDRIRPLWRHYYKAFGRRSCLDPLQDRHGVVFVVDCSDKLRMDEARDELLRLTQEEDLAGKPLLIFANKQADPSSLDILVGRTYQMP